jgi:putative ABC transport system permease protein
MIALGWMQLKHQKLRLLVAVLGISFAVVLILMQVGFREALFQSAVRYHQRFDFDVAIFGAESTFIVRPQSFSKRRLYQALGMDGVESVSPVYIAPRMPSSSTPCRGRNTARSASASGRERRSSPR